MKIVECIGLPGAGKTTLMNHLAAEDILTPQQALLGALRQSGPQEIHGLSDAQALDQLDDLFRLCDLSISFAGFWAEHPTLLEQISRMAAESTMDQAQKAYALSILFTHMRIYRKICADGPQDKTIIFDEGFLQRAMTLGVPVSGASLGDAHIRAYVEAVPPPSVVIILSLSPEMALRRLHERKSGVPPRMRHLDRSEQESFMDRSAHALSLAQETVHTPVIIVDATEDVETVSSRVLESLRSLEIVR